MVDKTELSDEKPITEVVAEHIKGSENKVDYNELRNDLMNKFKEECNGDMEKVRERVNHFGTCIALAHCEQNPNNVRSIVPYEAILIPSKDPEYNLMEFLSYDKRRSVDAKNMLRAAELFDDLDKAEEVYTKLQQEKLKKPESAEDFSYLRRYVASSYRASDLGNFAKELGNKIGNPNINEDSVFGDSIEMQAFNLINKARNQGAIEALVTELI